MCLICLIVGLVITVIFGAIKERRWAERQKER